MRLNSRSSNRMIIQRKLWHLSLVIFIFYVSYKILEPEIFGANYREMEEKEFRQLKVKHQIENKNSFRGHVHTNISRDTISTDRIISELVKKYKVDFRYPLNESPWTVASNWVTLRSVHPSDTPELGAILHSMATRKITQADVGYKGTQLKMTLMLEGGQRVVFKPKWFSRSHIITGKPYAGEDRHNGEIAAFHLGRILEFRRTPLVVGRVVDMATEIEPVAVDKLKNTFFKRDNNFCFYGKCYFCKGEETGVCGEGTKLEGALVLWLPGNMKLKKFRHPWSRTYKNNTLAKWEKQDKYCQNTILTAELYSSGPRLMDLVDASVLDYLIGNADRHLYETITDDKRAMMLLLDNGKSFGNPHVDVRSILAPLYQCCRIREATWARLLILKDGVLSSVLGTIIAQDPIAPILTDLHLRAIDRRVEHVLQTIKGCIAKYGRDAVIIKDR